MSNEEDELEHHQETPGISHVTDSNSPRYQVCPQCHGLGHIARPPSRKARLRYKRQRRDGDCPSESSPLPNRLEPCRACYSTGLQPCTTSTTTTTTTTPSRVVVEANRNNKNNNSLPTVAIVGGGIAGFALAIACQHRGIPYFVVERDAHFSQRHQGYGLTLQQASKALTRLLGPPVAEAIVQHSITSTKHVVHTANGTVVGEWGLRKWGRPQQDKKPKRQNLHIARQALRRYLWQAVEPENILWNARLVQYQETDDDRVQLSIQIRDDTDETNTITRTADLLVGADGIRSQVRRQLVGEATTPLRYLGCLVVLGICPLDDKIGSHPLLDGATVFQTADGTTRMYMMPYSSTQTMWQLSFPVSQAEACRVSTAGPTALLQQAVAKCGSWHAPIPKILQYTPVSLVSGYPVYDRALLQPGHLSCSSKQRRVTLMGDACHPMSPFKGQGANQALLDALSLANALYISCHVHKKGLDDALQTFEEEMLTRSATKVQASAEAVQVLHSPVVLHEGNVTRGAAGKTFTNNDNQKDDDEEPKS